ncbi:hypothetical protein JHK82_040626 [Glycine max]|uniref:Uncharacterized protein n=2 Tax=Glycine subgen. Soja TaxID=1462606 RepID=K7M867_SOYBN|nr:hypothetical protein JHK87_040653 [Glycine soja]KAG4966445.1 hypothetical protein JHK85_041420 [Glycine max]KAG5111403.1 hypothetical protein JHK82_040626 [Glycine max]KAG5122693.1 hypothetical protein JHK84_041033 [Glycine max]KAH1095451.1 hypothetical protein GYH30_040648 [Glycine max]|eukprot:XP_025981113.1 transcription factor DIVARICATA-like [Glycine max]
MAGNRENAAAGANPIRVRRTHIRWTEEEHRRFLRGIELYGASNVRDIAKNVVLTKTPAQVSSHAQKYFQRQKSGKKARPSIFDIEPVVAQPQNIHDSEPVVEQPQNIHHREPVVEQPHNAELPEQPIQQGLNQPNNIITNDFLANFK